MQNKILKLFSKLYAVGNKRYVNKFIPVFQVLTPGKSTLETDIDKEVYSDLMKIVSNYKKIVERYPQVKELNELLYLDVKDVPDLKFSIKLINGDIKIDLNWDTNIHPDFVIPIYSQNILKLVDVTQDGEIDLKEAYRIIRVLFVPFLRGLYQADYSHLPEDKSYMQLDDFIQVEVNEEEGETVEHFEGVARATAVNVDNQWLIFEGWQGDPDIKYVMNTMQALKFAYLIRVKLIKGRPNLSQLHEIVEEYNQLKKEVTVYERSWH